MIHVKGQICPIALLFCSWFHCNCRASKEEAQERLKNYAATLRPCIELEYGPRYLMVDRFNSFPFACWPQSFFVGGQVGKIQSAWKTCLGSNQHIFLGSWLSIANARLSLEDQVYNSGAIVVADRTVAWGRPSSTRNNVNVGSRYYPDGTNLMEKHMVYEVLSLNNIQFVICWSATWSHFHDCSEVTEVQG